MMRKRLIGSDRWRAAVHHARRSASSVRRNADEIVVQVDMPMAFVAEEADVERLADRAEAVAARTARHPTA